MKMFKYFVCGFFLFLHKVSGQATDIRGTFVSGNVKLTWIPDSRKHLIDSESVNITLIRENETIIRTDSVSSRGHYIQKDILNYTSFRLSVITRFKDNNSAESVEYTAFEIPQVIHAQSGDDIKFTLKINFFPIAGYFYIKNADTDVKYSEVTENKVVLRNASKYSISRTYIHGETREVTVIIYRVTTADAGYIETGTLSNRNSRGVVLAVKGKPTKPFIHRYFTELVGTSITLSCQSQSTSCPTYWKFFREIRYKWYRNDTELTTPTADNKYTFTLRKKDKYDNISCIAREEELDSEHSDFYMPNPLYGPEDNTVTVSPKTTSIINKIEGERLGPYTCSADCNPPCTYQWKRTSSGGLEVLKVAPGPVLRWPHLNRNMAGIYQCNVQGKYSNSKGRTTSSIKINLDIFYMSAPLIYIDGKNLPTGKILGKKGQSMEIACYVNAHPTPTVKISEKESNRTVRLCHAVWCYYQYSIDEGFKCGDVGIYVCEGQNNASLPNIKAFEIERMCDVLPPNHVSGQAISATAIQLTWKTNADSLPIKTYLIYQLFEASWELIANETVDNSNTLFSYVVDQRLLPERSYSFGVQSCNTEKCSAFKKVLGIHTAGLSNSGKSIDTTTVGIGLGTILVLGLFITIARWKMNQTRREICCNSSDDHIDQRVQFNDNKDGSKVVIDQQLPSEEDKAEYVTIDDASNCPNSQLESLVGGKYDDLIGIIKTDGTKQEYLERDSDVKNTCDVVNLQASNCVATEKNALEFQKKCLYKEKKGNTERSCIPLYVELCPE